MSKGSQRRPEDDEAFRRSWEKIFGKKEKVPPVNPDCKHDRATYGDPMVCLDCGKEILGHGRSA